MDYLIGGIKKKKEKNLLKKYLELVLANQLTKPKRH